jgi:hypothetical protein
MPASLPLPSCRSMAQGVVACLTSHVTCHSCYRSPPQPRHFGMASGEVEIAVLIMMTMPPIGCSCQRNRLRQRFSHSRSDGRPVAQPLRHEPSSSAQHSRPLVCHTSRDALHVAGMGGIADGTPSTSTSSPPLQFLANPLTILPPPLPLPLPLPLPSPDLSGAAGGAAAAAASSSFRVPGAASSQVKLTRAPILNCVKSPHACLPRRTLPLCA